MSDVSREVRLDFGRRARIGIEEAVLCENKTVAQIAHILEKAAESDRNILLTRLDEAQYQALNETQRAAIDYHALSATGFFGLVTAPTGAARIAIVTGGTSDARVAYEAARTLAYAGVASEMVFDVGVAGLWRLLDQVDRLASMDAVIAVAGMDAALVSVVGGLVPGLVIGVPTSTGYGASNGGETALRSALVSCSPGVVVVNIDNGYGAACAALRVVGGERAVEPERAAKSHAS